MGKFDFDGYARLLAKWTVFSQKHLYVIPEDNSLICYGNGTGTNWGMQTQLKAMSAFAVAAKLKEIDVESEGISRDLLLSEAISMLRFALRTHLTGDFVCTDGNRWGHSWIFALGIERMFHAIELLWDDMDDGMKTSLRTLLISEADFLVDEYEIVAGVVENNKPESNIWNGALLYRTAALYPDAPRCDEYLEKAYRFFANGISVESDENSNEIVAERRIGDVFVGANLFDSFSCNHHRYLNIGYMNICISNIAMLHFFLKSKGIEPNPIIYHNLRGLWRLVRSTTFDDGRLLRIGGDTRARYCYCQDYALVGWQLIEDVLGEDCTGLENAWLDILRTETEANGDGSFLSERFGYFERTSPLYYTRLESDRANSISLSLYWHYKYGLDPCGKASRIESWSDEYHGSAFVSEGERFASFAWRGAEYPMALILPKTASDLAEWRGNLTSRVFGVGNKNADDVIGNYVRTFDGGFITAGSSLSYCDEFGEGQKREDMAKKEIAFAALPDGKTVLSIQRVTAVNRVFVKECGGIFWSIPNDIYNHGVRTIEYEGGAFTLHGAKLDGRVDLLDVGKYLTVDGKIGIASTSPMSLVRRGKRQIDIRGRQDSGTLYCEEIASHLHLEPFWADRHAVLSEVGFAVSLTDVGGIRKMSESLYEISDGDIRGVGVVGGDGVEYLLLYNLADVGTEAVGFSVGGAMLHCLSESESGKEITISAKEAKLYKIIR